MNYLLASLILNIYLILLVVVCAIEWRKLQKVSTDYQHYPWRDNFICAMAYPILWLFYLIVNIVAFFREIKRG